MHARWNYSDLAQAIVSTYNYFSSKRGDRAIRFNFYKAVIWSYYFHFCFQGIQNEQRPTELRADTIANEQCDREFGVGYKESFLGKRRSSNGNAFDNGKNTDEWSGFTDKIQTWIARGGNGCVDHLWSGSGENYWVSISCYNSSW